MSPQARLRLKIYVGILACLLTALLLLVWRLSNSSIIATNLTPYIESGIDIYLPGTHTQIDHTVLTWDNIEHTISLHAENVKVSYRDGTLIADVPTLDIQLSVIALLFGQFVPVAMTIDHPQIKLERNKNGNIRFGDMASTSSDDNDDMRGTLAHIANNLTHDFATHHIEITRVVLDVHDEKTASDWAVSVPEISLKRTGLSLVGETQIAVTQKDQTSTVEFYYKYDRIHELHIIETRFDAINPSFFAGGRPATIGLPNASLFDLPLSGTISASFDRDLNIEAGSLNIEGGEGVITYTNFWDNPRAVTSLQLVADYNRKEKKLTIAKGNFDFGGPTLTLTADGTPPAIPTNDLDFTIAINLDNWPIDQYADLWPKPIIANTRDWVTSSLSKGKFTHGEANIKGTLVWNDLENIAFTEASGKIAATGARVEYVTGMPALENVNADGSFDLSQMTIQVNSGEIGDLKAEPFTIQMTNLDKDDEQIDIPVRFIGSIPDVLKLIDHPPLEYAKALGITPDDVTGNAEGRVELRFPLIKTLMFKDIDIKANANLTNVVSSKLIDGVDIMQGNIGLALDTKGFNIDGNAALDKIPFHIAMVQNFVASEGKPLRQAKLTGVLSEENWPMLGLSILKGTKGSVPIVIDFTEREKGKATLSGHLDFGSAEIHLEQMNWKKPAGVPATLTYTALINKGENIKLKSINFEGGAAVVKGEASLTPDWREVLSLDLDPLDLGRTNATLHFSETKEDPKTLKFMVDGNVLDVSGLKGNDEPAHLDPRLKEYHVKVGKLYTSVDGFISKVEGYALRDPIGWSAISMEGLADGEHPLHIDLTPKEDGHRVFSLTCDDFGKAMKGLGFTSTVKEGNLEIHGTSSVENPRVITGTAKIGHFAVSGLPALALLLNATSPFGFAGLVTDNVEFEHLSGKFKWQGDEIELIDVRAAGTSVGMNISGKVDMNTGASNLQGTLVPFSLFNSLIGSIPILGDILTGGSGGGVLAVAYTITGSLSNPKVGVNPISLLTPGFLRNLFFKNDDDSLEEPTSGTVPADTKPLPAITNFNKTPG